MDISYTEWCNRNESNRYPFTDLVLPDYVDIFPDELDLSTDIIVDLSITTVPYFTNRLPFILPPNAQGFTLYKLRFFRVADGTAYISVEFAFESEVYLFGIYNVEDTRGYRTMKLESSGSHISGTIVFGNFKLPDMAPGTSVTLVSRGSIAPVVDWRVVSVVPYAPYMAIGRASGSEVSGSGITGDIRLEGGGSLRIKADPDNPDTILLSLDAEAAENFAPECDTSVGASTPIKTINGVQADSNGRITLEFLRRGGTI